jgi:hypothetical protein
MIHRRNRTLRTLMNRERLARSEASGRTMRNVNKRFVKVLTSMSLLGLSVVVPACSSGKDVPIGQTKQPVVRTGGCTPEACANATPLLCAQAVFPNQDPQPVEFTYVCRPDPYAGLGEGSDPPAGTCMNDCFPTPSADAGELCPPSACPPESTIACAQVDGEPEKKLTNVRCIPDPYAGRGTDPVGQCMLVGDCQ